jgi:hypothetical protein
MGRKQTQWRRPAAPGTFLPFKAAAAKDSFSPVWIIRISQVRFAECAAPAVKNDVPIKDFYFGIQDVVVIASNFCEHRGEPNRTVCNASHGIKSACKTGVVCPEGRQTRSATYVLPFSEQNGKIGRPMTQSSDLPEQCASRHPLESSPNFGQVTGGKRALKSDQFTVTHDAASCGRVNRVFSHFFNTFAARHLVTKPCLTGASPPRLKLPRDKQLNWWQISATARRGYLFPLS